MGINLRERILLRCYSCLEFNLCPSVEEQKAIPNCDTYGLLFKEPASEEEAYLLDIEKRCEKEGTYKSKLDNQI
ncbi:MAG: hypothetical protein KJ623_02710 [Nanoarchaeota archaeon]|nr:hypothetical protein [Nanoarchaeota archaeon]MBU0962524.1 hypothetical protein [Nanoarchaeota archaeon]